MAGILLPDILWLFGNSVGRAALNVTVKPGALKPWVDGLTEYVSHYGKFTKFQAGYIPFPLPPLFWDYKCRRCRFWQGNFACSLVDGEILPQGWCAVWCPPDGVKQFSWVGEWMHGDIL